MSPAEAGPHPLLDHAGAWTEEAYLALPGDRRVELVDGSLLVAPSTDEAHDRAVAAVRAAVAAALPEGLEVTGPVALRLSPGRILVPDLVVAARRGAAEEPGGVRDSGVALVVIDVVGSGNGVADRWFKPQLYAGSRIPYALLIDRDEPFAIGSMLIGGRYHEYAHAGAHGVLRLEEPFALELDLSSLAAAAPVTSPGDAAGPAEPADTADMDESVDAGPGDAGADDPAGDHVDGHGEYVADHGGGDDRGAGHGDGEDAADGDVPDRVPADRDVSP
ncbi:MAG: Uma2 family endonuclease [Pseudonocardiales bacterium]|jgi:hypothetical protein|nr:Uma2 family endonuclease [Pseudonocardiales bacterium]